MDDKIKLPQHSEEKQSSEDGRYFRKFMITIEAFPNGTEEQKQHELQQYLLECHNIAKECF